jgi:hypothetical protein
MFLSLYWAKGIKADVMGEHISRALKSATTELQYPTNKGIPITRINTDSLKSGRANALALAGYSDTQIKKWVIGAGPHSRSTSERNWHAMPEGCRET